MHDIGKFAGFDNYDMALNNRTTNDLERNVFLIHQLIEFEKEKF
jgi:guanylate kinase